MEDEQRFDAAFRTHHDAIRRYLLRRCADQETVDDLVAETFLVAWRRRDRLPHDDALPWLYVVARNQLANSARRAKNHDGMVRRLQRQHPEQSVHDTPARPAAPPVLVALQTLSSMDQEVLRLHAFEGLTREQGAVVLGCRPATYGVRLHRATRRLRAALERPATPATAARPAAPPTRRHAR